MITLAATVRLESRRPFNEDECGTCDGRGCGDGKTIRGLSAWLDVREMKSQQLSDFWISGQGNWIDGIAGLWDGGNVCVLITVTELYEVLTLWTPKHWANPNFGRYTKPELFMGAWECVFL